MRLRHKKPLNPYKGQTNNDKNEFNDDDFRQQASPHKKNGSNSTDQIFKYARLLAKFIKTVNDDYLEYEAQNAQKPHDLPLEIAPDPIHPDPPLPRELPPSKREQTKQLKQIPKIQSRQEPRHDNKDQKPPSKKKMPTEPAPPPKETKNCNSQILSTITPPSNRFNLQQKTPVDNKEKSGFADKPQKMDQGKGNGRVLTHSSVPHINESNPPAGFNSNGPSLLDMMPNAMGNTNGQMLMGTPHPQAMMSPMMNMSSIDISEMLLRMNSPQNYIYNMQGMNMQGMPMGMNMLGVGMGLGMPTNQYLLQPLAQPKPPVNLFHEQVKALKQASKSQEKDRGSLTFKQAFPLKRSAYHVTIAYRIYLEKLKKKGGQPINLDNIQDIDPIRNSRLIKSSNQPAKSSKDIQRKKK